MLTTATIAQNKRDPFNWPALQRNDLISATCGLSSERDMIHMTKPSMRQNKRLESANLCCDDI